MPVREGRPRFRGTELDVAFQREFQVELLHGTWHGVSVDMDTKARSYGAALARSTGRCRAMMSVAVCIRAHLCARALIYAYARHSD
jgi:hypothetical protein